MICRTSDISTPRSTTPPAFRWLGALLALVLFGADTFQPVIGLVEVKREARNKAQSDPQPAQPVVLSIHAWQWHGSGAELWPTFVFQPTINAGSAGSARSTRSIASDALLAALPPCPLNWSLPAPASCAWLAAPIDEALRRQIARCRQICPVGPPLASWSFGTDWPGATPAVFAGVQDVRMS